GDDPRTPLERSAERRRNPDRHLGGEVDVDKPGDTVLPEEAGRGPRLPDHALVDVGTGLDLFVRIDPDARHDHRLRADRYLAADRHPFVDAHVGPDVAGASEDGALDERAATH